MGMLEMDMCCFVMVATFSLFSEPPSADQLLEKSLAFHDPSGSWSTFNQTLQLRETRPNGTDRHLWVTLDLPGERFVYEQTNPGEQLLKSVVKGECSASLNGSSDFSEEDAQKYRMSCELIQRYHNYYLYLYGLPMKLKDPGTQIDPQVKEADFMGQPVWAMRVTYSEEVGKDIWYFYFDKSSYQLVGCRFFHDEAANDGEYIIFEDVYSLGRMKFPKNRTWYTNKEAKLLGSDHLEGHKP